MKPTTVRCYRLFYCLLLAALLSACGRPTGAPTNPPSPAPFRSDETHLSVLLPAGWSAAEGPVDLNRAFAGLVAFNSWERPGFWVPALREGDTTVYSRGAILGQVPEGGAYVALTEQVGGPAPNYAQYGPEYEAADLAGLWQVTDCRQDGGATWADFNKWGRRLRLEVYCRPDTSDETAAAVQELLSAWRFDRAPAGDAGWASVQARLLLPPAVHPEQFPIITNRPTGPDHQQSLVGRGSDNWVTEAWLQGDAVWLMFKYRWHDPPQSQSSADCPEDRCHWWRFAARADGSIQQTDEGGAPLP